MADAVVAALTPDLLNATWRRATGAGDKLRGHCAVASEALYHLLGGAQGGYMPVVASFHMTPKGRVIFGSSCPKAQWQKGTHWWLKGPKDGMRGGGDVIDLTAGQFKAPFPYHRGMHCGFMQPQRVPSKRAQIVIDRVVGMLGGDYCAAVRRARIAAFTSSVRACGANRAAGRKRKALNFS